MESVIRDNIIKYAKYYLLYNNLLGVLFNRSTTNQLLECLFDWNVVLDTGQKTDVIYIDLKKNIRYFSTLPTNKKTLTTVTASKQIYSL